MKILYVATISNTINSFLIPHIELLLEQGHHVDIACNIQREIDPRLTEKGCRVFHLEFRRSPFKKQNYTTCIKLKRLLNENRYDLVHTHTPVASACVRFVCMKTGTKVIYTAHGFHFYNGAPLFNWLVYYMVEKLLARYTDSLITVNQEDYRRAQHFKARKVRYIPGIGVDTKMFPEASGSRDRKREELGISKDTVVLLSIGELSKRKNHKTSLKAIAAVDKQDILYLICGTGKMENYLKGLAADLGVEGKVRFLGYRNDIPELCAASDVFLFPSYQEGLPVALMEAMAAGLPAICSNIRGNTDLIEDQKGGYLFEPDDVNGFADAIGRLAKDPALRKTMGENNIKKVKQFDIEHAKRCMSEIYTEVLSGV